MREMLARREAENAIKRTTIAPQTSSGIKHDWTHHFKAVRERPAAFRAAMTADAPKVKAQPQEAVAAPATTAPPARPPAPRPDSRRFVHDPIFDVISEDLPPVRTGRAPSASGSGMPGATTTTTATSPSGTDTFGTRRSSYGMQASPIRGAACDAYGFPIHGLPHSSSLAGGLDFGSDYDLLRDAPPHGTRGTLPHAHSLGHGHLGLGPHHAPQYGAGSNPFDTGLLHGPSSNGMCGHSMLPYDSSDHSMLTCTGLPSSSGAHRGQPMRGPHHLSMPQVLPDIHLPRRRVPDAVGTAAFDCCALQCWCRVPLPGQ